MQVPEDTFASYEEVNSRETIVLFENTILTDNINLDIKVVNKPIKSKAQPQKIRTVHKTTFVKYPEFCRPVLTTMSTAITDTIMNRCLNVLKLRHGSIDFNQRLEWFEQAYFSCDAKFKIECFQKDLVQFNAEETELWL